MQARLRARAASAVAVGAALALVPAGAAVADDAAAITRISVGFDGSQADGSSNAPAVSGNGRWFAYSSNATNLVPGDTNGLLDIFLYDRTTGTTELVTKGVGGAPSNAAAYSVQISTDGRFVTFDSEATNLVAGDTDGQSNVFVWSRTTKQITKLPGVRALWPDISNNGRWISYASYEALVPGDTDTYVDVYLYDRNSGTVQLVSRNAAGTAIGGFESAVSDNGRYVAFGGTFGGGTQLFDRNTGTVSPITATSSGLAISGDGAFVSFTTWDSLVPADTNGNGDIYLWERRTGKFTLVSANPDGTPADGFSSGSRLNSDGRYVTFWSTDGNLAGTETTGWGTQGYRFDRQTGQNTLIAVPVKGEDGGAEGSDLSADGTVIGFMSLGEDLVADDSNGERDVFVTVLP